MTRQEAIALSLEIKREAVNEKEKEKNRKMATLRAQSKEFCDIENSLKALGARLAVTALSGNAAQLKELKAEMQELSDKKACILKNADIKDTEYECKKCHDTGFVNGEYCDCIKQAADAVMLEDFYKNTQAKNCTFENFSISFYADERAKKRMTDILGLAKQFAENFNKETKENLLFMGNTGLGKTHLSLAVANKVIKKGFSVLYSPAYNLFSKIETEHFSQHTNTTYNSALETDLLIIDDLGGEFVSPYIQSVVYNIINSRLISHKPTIVNTNLAVADIEEKYTPRVASRLIGEYTAKTFLGQDIRILKKMKEN